MQSGIVIIGTGAHARKLGFYAKLIGLKVDAFVDDNPKAISPFSDIPCVHAKDAVFASGQSFFVAIGNSVARKELLERFQARGWIPIALIHPFAYVAKDVIIGLGAVVGANSVVETGSVIGTGAIVDAGVIVDHDCSVGEYCHLTPGCVLSAATIVHNGMVVRGKFK
jgi:UDP-3-O-[3-hydroxymyristoyl] glucosamine N-acyltransferase